MNTNMNFDANGNFIDAKAVSRDSVKAFVTQVYAWMFGALTVTAAVAYAFVNSSLINLLFNETGHATPLFWIAMVCPVIIVFAMNMGIERFSTGVIIGLHFLYAALVGVSLSVIFLLYNDPIMIIKAFSMTAGAFGIMAVVGFTTKADLSRFGMILMMAVIGIFIAAIANYFLQNTAFSWLIDIVCIVVFTGLVAWKMQLVRQYGENYGTTQPKMAVFMGLSLYITFLNLFLTILRMMNRR